MSEAADEQRQAAIENGPNLDVAQDLRDVADWLEQHPELPKAKWGSVVLRYPGFGPPEPSAREMLVTVAGALGDRASESTTGRDVEISCRFGVVTVKAVASIEELEGFRPPGYSPILAPAPEVDLPISTEELIAEAER